MARSGRQGRDRRGRRGVRTPRIQPGPDQLAGTGGRPHGVHMVGKGLPSGSGAVLLRHRMMVATLATLSVTTMTLRIPDDLAPSIRAAASEAGLSVNAYVVRAARRAATLDAGRQLAALGLGDDLAGEGDIL
ncbi:toxin-antitoxin system HicB family antitoxin [Streptomyces echinatus]|uniref:toxin-antitoxin system HicB family antitoxin n=1 Tax=Streptomyces echinatus TaxID=67293 RepID=UPI00378E23AE